MYRQITMHVDTRLIQLQTRHPFRIARPGASVDGTQVSRLLIKLEHDGIAGFGEAAPTPYYLQSVESSQRAVEEMSREGQWLADDPLAVVPIVDRLIEAFNDQRAAVAAVDAALHDWIGRRFNVPVWRWLGLDASATPPTSMTIGIDEPELIRIKIDEARRWSALKIKVGTDRDIETLECVRKLAPDARLRLDANGAWLPDEAAERIRQLERFKPELIEQPIAAGQLDALEDIHAQSRVPIFVDEDCVRVADVVELRNRVSGVNIKLAKCGGILEANRMIETARACGLRTMLGCMVESSIGIAAAAQLASRVDFVDLDGHLLLAEDPFDAVDVVDEIVRPRSSPGLGIGNVEWH